MSATLHEIFTNALRDEGFTGIEVHRSARIWTLSARSGDETVVIQLADTSQVVRRHGTVDRPIATIDWTMPALPDETSE